MKPFKKGLQSLKSKDRLWSAILAIVTQDGVFNQFTKTDNIFTLFNNVCPIEELEWEFREELRKHKGGGVFKCAALTKKVNDVMGTLLENEDVMDEHEDWQVVNSKSFDGDESRHSFACRDAVSGLSSLQSILKTKNIGLVILDPPFGILDHEWDQELSDGWWRQLFTFLSDKYPEAPLVIFLSYQMLTSMLTKVTSYGYKHVKIVSWLKAASLGQTYGRQSYPCNLILVASKSKLHYNASDHPNIVNGNFVTSRRPKWFNVDEEILNETEKPVDLMRLFIKLHCRANQVVLDVFCGSGSGAVAAASLGYDSISFDVRQGQISGSTMRLKRENLKPSWYPEPELFMNFKVLQKYTAIISVEPADDPEEPEDCPPLYPLEADGEEREIVERDSLDCDFSAAVAEEAREERTGEDLGHVDSEASESESPGTSDIEAIVSDSEPIV